MNEKQEQRARQRQGISTGRFSSCGGYGFTKPQRQLLRAVREDGLLLPEILGTLGISSTVFMRWLRRTYFRDALREVRRDLRLRMWLDVELLGNSATQTLTRFLRDKKYRNANPGLLEVCQTILQERDRLAKRFKRGGARGGKSSSRVVEPGTDLCHPDFKDQEKELDAILDGKHIKAAKAEEGAVGDGGN